MAIVTTDSKHYSNIAAAIRGKTGDETTYTPEEIPAGIDEVYEAGKQEGVQSEYDRFWDAFQDYGRRVNYEDVFSGAGVWTDITFKPKYDLIVNDGYNGYRMFHRLAVTNLAEALEKQDVQLDTTKCGTLGFMFQSSTTERIPTINCTNAWKYAPYGLEYTFQGCTRLKTIDKLVVTEELAYSQTFSACYSLENVTFEGVIGKNISFIDSSLLTDASVQSIIDHLKDLTGATTQTLTFHADVGAKITQTQKDAVSSKNWTLVY